MGSGCRTAARNRRARGRGAGGAARAPWLAALAALAALATLAGGCDSPEPASPERAAPRRIGVLLGIDLFAPTVSAFEQRLGELGDAGGGGIVYDVQHPRGDAGAMRRMAASFVEQRVDLIFAVTNAAALAAREAAGATATPVVFAIVLAPVRSGIIDDMREPAHHVTGVHNPLDVFIGKRLEFLHRLAPAVERIWVPYDPDYPTVPLVLPELRRVAGLLGMQLVEAAVRSPEEVAASARRGPGGEIDAVLVMPDTVVQRPRAWKAILAFAAARRVPVVGNTPEQVGEGALFSYLSDSRQSGREAAELADRILRAGTALPLPVVSSEPRLVLNAGVAEALGLAVDETTAALVDEYR